MIRVLISYDEVYHSIQQSWHVNIAFKTRLSCHAYRSSRAPYMESFVSVPCLLRYPCFIDDKPPQGLGTGLLSTGQAQRKESALWGYSLQTGKVRGRGRLSGSRAWLCLLLSLKENKGLWVLESKEYSLSSSLTPLSWGLDRSLRKVFCWEKNGVFRQASMLARAQVPSWLMRIDWTRERGDGWIGRVLSQHASNPESDPPNYKNCSPSASL